MSIVPQGDKLSLLEGSVAAWIGGSMIVAIIFLILASIA